MMHADELRALKVGEVVEVGWLLEGLAPDEPLVFRLEKADYDKGLFTFEAFYFDVPLGEWAAKINGEIADRKTGEVWEDVLWVQNTRKAS